MKLNQLPEVSICDIKSARSFINGDIRRMPPLLLRKITRKSTAVSVVFAFVFYWLIIEISLYKLFHTLGIFLS